MLSKRQRFCAGDFYEQNWSAGIHIKIDTFRFVCYVYLYRSKLLSVVFRTDRSAGLLAMRGQSVHAFEWLGACIVWSLTRIRAEFHAIVYLLFHVKVYNRHWSSREVIAHCRTQVHSHTSSFFQRRSSYVRYVHKAHFRNTIGASNHFAEQPKLFECIRYY